MTLMPVLAQLDGWPADNAAAGVTAAGGTIALHGPVDTPFPVASVTKVLSAVAVLLACEEGIVDLDEPAGPPGSTVRHLLAHASGLGPEAGTVLAAPGRKRIYSNAGFDVLGALVAERAEMPFGQYLAEGVAEPLGMAHTTLDGSPAAAAQSTVEDLVSLCRELLSPGALLAPETVAEATTPVFAELSGVLPGFGRHDPNPWGLGMEIRGAKQPHWTGRHNSPRTFGHFGRSGTFLWVDPDAEVACVALTDLDFGPWAATAWPELADSVLEMVAGHRD